MSSPPVSSPAPGRPPRGPPSRELPASKRLVLIDGNSLVYRAFYALPPLTNAEGEATGAVYGFATMLFKILEEERPAMMAVAFDLPAPTFRHEQYAEYKAGRKETPDGLRSQLAVVRELLAAMHIPAYDAQGFEADDIIGTLARKARPPAIASSSSAATSTNCSWLPHHISVMVPRRGISDTQVYDVEAVKERYGLPPEKLPDFRALRGDTSDNIPGVPGIGEKTATALISAVRLAGGVARPHAAQVTPPRIAQALQVHVRPGRARETSHPPALRSPIPLDEEQLQLKEPDRPRLLDLFRRLDFRSLAARFAAAPEAVPTEFRAAHHAGRKWPSSPRSCSTQDEVLVHPIADDGPGRSPPPSTGWPSCRRHRPSLVMRREAARTCGPPPPGLRVGRRSARSVTT